MWPLLLRPECFFLTSTSDFSGFFFVRSFVSIVVRKRWPADVGRYRFTAIFSSLLEGIQAAEFDLLTRLESNDGFLPIRLFAGRTRTAAREVLELSADVRGVDLDDVDFENLLDGMPNLRLGRVWIDFKGVLIVNRPRHRLLSDHRSHDDIARFH